jgi:lactobin A/cerein 7B family class IIb bacteriocin
MQELTFEQVEEVSGGIWANLGGAALGAAGAYFGASHGGASGLSSLGAAAAGGLGGFFSPVSGARSFALTLGVSYGTSWAGASFERFIVSMSGK